MTRAVACAVTVLALAGCAGPTVDVGYPDTVANRALLASVAPRKVVVAAVADHRAESARIGAEPVDGKPIVTSRPVPEIVRDAVVVELTKNGHEVVTGSGDMVVAVDIEEFWLDAVRSTPTQYVGRVAIALLVADARTGDRILSRRYVGIARRVGAADAKDVWRDVMDVALARTVHDVATDPQVVAAMAHAPR